MFEILLLIGGVLALLYFSYTAGKDKQTKKGLEDYVDASKKASDAKRGLTDESRKRLWNESLRDK